jgi:hypothetical protein
MSFNITLTPSSSQTIQLDFQPSTITSVNFDNNIITGTITVPNKPTGNVTLLNNSFPQKTFVAKRFYIVGLNNSGALTQFSNGNTVYPPDLSIAKTPYAEMVIEGTDLKSSTQMRLCFLMFTKPNEGSTGTSSLVTLLQSTASTSSVTTVDFGSAMQGAISDAQKNPQIQQLYCTYDADGYYYIVCTVPIYVTASLLFSNGIIDFTNSSRVKNYTVIAINDSAQWMECDYTPLGGETVNVLNVPIGSVSDLNSDQAFRQIVMFIVFLLALLLFYFVIPPLYQMAIYKISGGNNQANMCSVMKYVDIGMNVVLALLWIVLLSVGFTSKEENALDVLYSGFVILIMQVILAGTLWVAKLSSDFPFPQRQQMCETQKNNQMRNGTSGYGTSGYGSFFR